MINKQEKIITFDVDNGKKYIEVKITVMECENGEIIIEKQYGKESVDRRISSLNNEILVKNY